MDDSPERAFAAWWEKYGDEVKEMAQAVVDAGASPDWAIVSKDDGLHPGRHVVQFGEYEINVIQSEWCPPGKMYVASQALIDSIVDELVMREMAAWVHSSGFMN